MGRQNLARNHDARLDVEVSCTITKIPRCPKCEAANPTQLLACPICGEPAPPTETQFSPDAKLTLANLELRWYERILLAIGAWLRRLAKGMEP